MKQSGNRQIVSASETACREYDLTSLEFGYVS